MQYEARKGFGAAFLPAELMLAHSTTGLVPQILVSGDDGSSTEQVVSQVRKATEGLAGVQIVGRASADTADDGATSAWIRDPTPVDRPGPRSPPVLPARESGAAATRRTATGPGWAPRHGRGAHAYPSTPPAAGGNGPAGRPGSPCR